LPEAEGSAGGNNQIAAPGRGAKGLKAEADSEPPFRLGGRPYLGRLKTRGRKGNTVKGGRGRAKPPAGGRMLPGWDTATP